MKLFGNTSQGKFGKGAVRQPQEAEVRTEQPVQQKPAAQTQKPAAGRYTKKTSIFDYADLPAQERRMRMQADYRNTPVRKRKKSNRKKLIRALIAILIVAAIIGALWLTAIYSQLPLIRNLRDIWIQTAWSTMSHRWLATAFFPQSVIDECIARQEEVKQRQIGENSTDPPTLAPQEEVTEPSNDATEETQAQIDPEQEAFYELFAELDRDSAEKYFKLHPAVLKDGYSHIDLNEAGLEDGGTSIYTTQGDQVLAIDAENEVLLVRVWLKDSYTTSRGVLAIAKDPSLLHLYPSKGIGGYGQHIADIASNHNGLLGITGSGFDDPGGNGNGGITAGYCKCDGTEYGRHRGWGIKRIELKENNWLYINDAPNDCGDDVTDAVEFEPALIVNGKRMDINDYTATNPRACIGQTRKGEILMIVVEGRFVDSPGCSVAVCADKLAEYDCLTAMNLDGGTSAIMWYDGECVTRCSNTRTPEGRYLPNAWIYTYKD